jgi:hypothetical protein
MIFPVLVLLLLLLLVDLAALRFGVDSRPTGDWRSVTH